MVPEPKPHEKKWHPRRAHLAARIERIKAKVRRGGEDARIRVARAVDPLQRMHDEASRPLGEFQAAGGEAWDSVKSGTGRTWLEIESPFKGPA